MPVTSEFARLNDASRSRWMLDVSIDSRSPSWSRWMCAARSWRSIVFTTDLWRITFSATSRSPDASAPRASSRFSTTFAWRSAISRHPCAEKTWLRRIFFSASCMRSLSMTSPISSSLLLANISYVADRVRVRDRALDVRRCRAHQIGERSDEREEDRDADDLEGGVRRGHTPSFRVLADRGDDGGRSRADVRAEDDGYRAHQRHEP